MLSFDDEDVRDYVVSCLRELMIQEQHHAHLAGANDRSMAKRPSLTAGGEDVSKEMASLIAQNKTLQQRVAMENQNYQKMMSQFLEVNNDYNEKQHHNKILLKEREALQEQLAAKDKLFKEDTKMKFKLSQKLQKLQNENAMLKRTLGEKEITNVKLQEQLDGVRKMMGGLPPS